MIQLSARSLGSRSVLLFALIIGCNVSLVNRIFRGKAQTVGVGSSFPGLVLLSSRYRDAFKKSPSTCPSSHTRILHFPFAFFWAPAASPFTNYGMFYRLQSNCLSSLGPDNQQQGISLVRLFCLLAHCCTVRPALRVTGLRCTGIPIVSSAKSRKGVVCYPMQTLSRAS